MYGCTDVRTDGLVTITSQPKFLGLIGYQTQRQNECACSAFSRASGHFLVSGYDQKAVVTEKAPALCSS